MVGVPEGGERVVGVEHDLEGLGLPAGGVQPAVDGRPRVGAQQVQRGGRIDLAPTFALPVLAVASAVLTVAATILAVAAAVLAARRRSPPSSGSPTSGS